MPAADPNPVYPTHLVVSVGVHESISVGGDSSHSVGRNRSSSVQGNQTDSVGRTYTLTAADSLVLRCGAASLTMKKDGSIVISGKDITLDASGKFTAKSSGDALIKGSKIGSN
jgi:type VI secretion system secreted protein VgrG